MEPGNRPEKSTECPIQDAMLPRRGHDDVSLPLEGDWRMLMRKGKVAIGNSG